MTRYGSLGIQLAALVVALATAAPPLALATASLPTDVPTLPPSVVEIDAAARAAGNRKAEAEQLARQLLIRRWPVQVLKIRIDAAGSHQVAGIVLSGVKFHGSVDEHRFLWEVAWLVERTLTATKVEEVDLWTTVPIAVGKGEIVAGDFAEPTTRIVFSATIRRREANAVMQTLERGTNVFWDASWRASLRSS